MDKGPDIECVLQSFTSNGSIYISNLPAAMDITLLKKLRIGAILSVARQGRVTHSEKDIPFYLYIPADDHQEFELHSFFKQTYEFIQTARKSTNVLVHCMVGVSRSVTVVAAYLLKKYKYSLQEIFNTLRRKRSKINPNSGFIQQLKRYAQQEGISSCFKQESAHSRSKNKRSFTNQPKTTNSLFKTFEKNKEKHEEISKERQRDALKQKNDQNNQILINEQTFGRSLELKKGKSHEQKLNIQQAFSAQFSEFPQPRMRKASSFHTSEPKRDVSIQRKIQQVREKLRKSSHYSQYSRLAQKLQQSDKMTLNSAVSKQEMLDQQKSMNITTPSKKPNPPAQRYTPQFIKEQQNKQLFSAQLKLEPSFLFQRRILNTRRANHHMEQ